MKLLICTQAIDTNDPLLGFFHAWMAELAPHYEHITILALRVGERDLPRNVEVVPLGTIRILRIWRILTLSYRMRDTYDAVLVHMSQEFILLAGWLWKRLYKPVYLWRNHYAGSAATDRAARYCKKVFYTSKYSYTAKYAHAVRMPVGIDTEQFKRLPHVMRDPRGILFLGRLAPSKRPHVLIEALSTLVQKGLTFTAVICGAQAPQDRTYVRELEDMIHMRGLSRLVTIAPGIPQSKTPEMFNQHAIFVNCSPSGMYDKTLFEAAGCECVVIASSKDFAELVDKRFVFADGSAEDLARVLEAALTMPIINQQGVGVQMRNAAREHSLVHLVSKLVKEMN
jgi:glycosyltransferase involved in cell wall biosynthesis